MTAFVGNPNLLRLKNLQDEVSGDYINDAYVEATVVDTAGTNITGQTWPVEMMYVASSNGIYEAILDPDLAMTGGVTYIAEIDAYESMGGVLLGHWEFEFVPEVRRR